jgi:hypothetical protein
MSGLVITGYEIIWNSRGYSEHAAFVPIASWCSDAV